MWGQVYTFLDKMSFYTEVYKQKPNEIISKDDETLWRRQIPKLLYPLGKKRPLHPWAVQSSSTVALSRSVTVGQWSSSGFGP